MTNIGGPTQSKRRLSGAAVLVIARVVPIDLIIKERHNLWTKKPNNTLEQGETEAIRRETLKTWQERWTIETAGRWTKNLIPNHGNWIKRSSGEVGYYVTQILNGHGYFGKS